jgi:hypothetical protein
VDSLARRVQRSLVTVPFFAQVLAGSNRSA